MFSACRQTALVGVLFAHSPRLSASFSLDPSTCSTLVMSEVMSVNHCCHNTGYPGVSGEIAVVLSVTRNCAEIGGSSRNLRLGLSKLNRKYHRFEIFEEVVSSMGGTRDCADQSTSPFVDLTAAP